MAKVKKYLKVFKSKLIALFSVCLLLLLLGLPWLALAVLCMTLLYLFLLSFKMIRSNYFISFPITLLCIIGLAIFTRLFIFEIYNVPSESMESALYPGDHIIVSKLNYGPKMPRSPFEIPWINLFFYLNQKGPVKGDASRWKYYRLSGFSKIKHNDIIVFKRSADEDEFLVKRCIGLSGDTLQIVNGRVSINNKMTKNVPTVKLTYQLCLNAVGDFINVADSLNINYYINGKRNDQRCVNAVLNADQFNFLKHVKSVNSIEHIVNRQTSYPFNKQLEWTVDNLGSLVIPAKGITLPINKTTFALYLNILKNVEKVFIEEIDGTFYMAGIPVTHYTFKHNYYFMMGDNRDNSNDSRYWGFVAEQDVEGKVVYAL